MAVVAGGGGGGARVVVVVILGTGGEREGSEEAGPAVRENPRDQRPSQAPAGPAALGSSLSSLITTHHCANLPCTVFPW